MKVRGDLFGGDDRARRKMLNDALKGAGIGAGAGAIIGGIYGGYKAEKEIEKQPLESITLNWKEPIYKQEVIGKIPEDYYEPAYGGIGWGHSVKPTEPVIRDVPVKDQAGNVVYKEVTKTFTGHGKPVVNWVDKPVKEPHFEGYHEETVADYDYYTDDDGNVYRELRGYWHYFYPDIRYQTIDKYQVPEVKFEHGVDVMGKVLTYAALGAAIGGVTGGVIGALISSARVKQRVEKKG